MTELNLLLVEDNEDDAILLINELKYGGLMVKNHLRVQSEKALREALENNDWDIVISDYTMPGFDGMQALNILKHSGKDIPFILISGMIGEETAVAALKAGASDYLLKDRLSRLSKAVQKELNDAKQRQHLKETQEALATAKKMADLANQRKSHVLAFVAHEFKNPLQAITLFADLLIDNVYGSLNEKQYTSVHNISTATHHLKMLVSDILDIAAIEAGKIKLNMASVDIHALLLDVITITEEQAKQQRMDIKLYINTDQPIKLFADEKKTSSNFINLISNSIKYSQKDTTIKINAMPNLDNQTYCIAVTDQGIGIAPEEVNQLFKEFYRVDNRHSAQTEGVGLGLALTKTLVELHNGYIRVESVEGEGSTFSVVLPLNSI